MKTSKYFWQVIGIIALIALTSVGFYIFNNSKPKTLPESALKSEEQKQFTFDKNSSSKSDSSKIMPLVSDDQNDVVVLDNCDIALKFPKNLKLVSTTNSNNSETKLTEENVAMTLKNVSVPVDVDFASFTDATVDGSTIAYKKSISDDGGQYLAMHTACLQQKPETLFDVNTGSSYKFQQINDLKNDYIEVNFIDEFYFASHKSTVNRDAYVFKLKNNGKYLAIFSTFKFSKANSDVKLSKDSTPLLLGEIVIQPNSLAPSKASIVQK